jgi:hypothetical protein
VLALSLTACSGATPQSGGATAAPDAGEPDDAAVVVDAPTSGPATCPEGTAFRDIANKVVVEATVDGTTYKVLYDTGAPTSTFDPSLQQKIGAGPHTIGLAGKTRQIPSIDFAFTAASQFPGVAGIVGTDFAGKFAVTLDYPRTRLWLDETRDEAALMACSHVEGKPAIVDAILDYYVYVPGHLESKEGWFLVDSGASYGVVPKPVFDDLVAKKPRPSLPGFFTPANIGTFWADLSMVGTMETGGQTVSGILVRTVDDGLLGSPGEPATADKPLLGVLPHDYLANFVVTVDFPQKKVRLDAAKSATRTGLTRATVAGIGLEDQDTPPIHAATVLAGSSAAEQGIAVGDEIVKIAGTAIAQIPAETRPWKLVSLSGTPSVAVTVSHAGVSRDVTLQMRDLLTPP